MAAGGKGHRCSVGLSLAWSVYSRPRSASAHQRLRWRPRSRAPSRRTRQSPSRPTATTVEATPPRTGPSSSTSASECPTDAIELLGQLCGRLAGAVGRGDRDGSQLTRQRTRHGVVGDAQAQRVATAGEGLGHQLRPQQRQHQRQGTRPVALGQTCGRSRNLDEAIDLVEAVDEQGDALVVGALLGRDDRGQGLRAGAPRRCRRRSRWGYPRCRRPAWPGRPSVRASGSVARQRPAGYRQPSRPLQQGHARAARQIGVDGAGPVGQRLGRSGRPDLALVATDLQQDGTTGRHDLRSARQQPADDVEAIGPAVEGCRPARSWPPRAGRAHRRGDVGQVGQQAGRRGTAVPAPRRRGRPRRT